MYVDDIKLAGKKQNIDPMLNMLMKQVDSRGPTSFLDHVYLGCTQRECETIHDIVDNCRSLLGSRIPAGATENLPSSGRPEANISTWSYDVEGHTTTCVECYRELSNKTTQQWFKVSTQCLDDRQIKEEELESVGQLSKDCSQIDALVDQTFYNQ